MALRSLRWLVLVATTGGAMACGSTPAQSAASTPPASSPSTPSAATSAAATGTSVSPQLAIAATAGPTAATVTPSVTPTVTPTVTPSVTPSVKPSATPSAAERQRANDNRVRVRIATPSSLGFMVAVDFPAPVRHVAFRSLAGAEWTPALGSPDTLTTTAMVALRKSDIIKGRGHFLVRATKADGSVLADTALEFDADASNMQTAKDALNALPTIWVAVKVIPPATWVYFTGALTYKHVLSAIRYQVNDGADVRSVRFAPSDEAGIGADDEFYTIVPGPVRAVTVELLYKDGTTSGKRRLLASDITLK